MLYGFLYLNFWVVGHLRIYCFGHLIEGVGHLFIFFQQIEGELLRANENFWVLHFLRILGTCFKENCFEHMIVFLNCHVKQNQAKSNQTGLTWFNSVLFLFSYFLLKLAFWFFKFGLVRNRTNLINFPTSVYNDVYVSVAIQLSF